MYALLDGKRIMCKESFTRSLIVKFSVFNNITGIKFEHTTGLNGSASPIGFETTLKLRLLTEIVRMRYTE